MESKELKVRFISSFFANAFRSGISLFTGLLLARWLGPSEYGRMSFLIVSFTAFRTLVDMGSSSAFFTFLSQQTRTKKFISLYLRWVGIQFLFLVLLIGLFFPNHLINQIWKGEPRSVIILALITTFIQLTIWPITSQMAEASRKTIAIQKLNTLIIVLHLLVLLILWKFGKLFLPFIFIALIIEWSIASWIASRMYSSSEVNTSISDEVNDTNISVFREFYIFCLPFIPYSIFNFIFEFADRWMLQNWGGAKEQAYYTISYQFATISLLATTSILRIFWKEIAEANFKKDKEKVKLLYLRISKGLFFIGSIFAGALIPWTAEIISIMLGLEYKDAYFSMLLMFIYPVHQSIGQIGSTMLLATGKTHLQVKLGILFMCFSIILVYFMLAPVNAFVPGLGLASDGLAWKMVIMQIIQVNVLIWILSKNFNWKYEWKFQIYSLLPIVLIGYTIKKILFYFITIPLIVNIIIYSILFTLFILLFIYNFPNIAGISRNEMNEIKSKVINLKIRNII